MTDPESFHGLLHRAVDGMPIVLTRETATAIKVALFDKGSEIARLRKTIEAIERREIAHVERTTSEEARANQAERELSSAMLCLTACAFAKTEQDLSTALVAARAWLGRGATP